MFHGNGHEHVVVDIAGGRRGGGYVERTLKRVHAARASGNLLLGCVGHSEYFVFEPQVILVAQPSVAQYVAQIVHAVAVGHRPGRSVHVHKRRDEASYLYALHVVVVVGCAALGHKGNVHVAQTVVVVATGIHARLHVERGAYLRELLVGEPHGIHRGGVAQNPVVEVFRLVGQVGHEILVVERHLVVDVQCCVCALCRHVDGGKRRRSDGECRK